MRTMAKKDSLTIFEHPPVTRSLPNAGGCIASPVRCCPAAEGAKMKVSMFWLRCS
jgi:hypothetical protein